MYFSEFSYKLMKLHQCITDLRYNSHNFRGKLQLHRKVLKLYNKVTQSQISIQFV